MNEEHSMNNTSYIAAVDPGNEKTGVAILSQAGELIYRTIVETKTFNASFESILSTYLGRFVPKGMQFPPEPVDDLTAYVIGKRYTKQLKEEDHNKLQDCKVEDDLEAKRLAAIKKLYNEGDTHE